MPIESSRRRSSLRRIAGLPGLALRRRLLAVAVGVLCVMTGCDGPAAEPPGAGEVEYEGVSRDQIQLEAESMTPEEAERLGIVDTTIHIEPPMNPDSVLPLLPTPLVPTDSGR